MARECTICTHPERAIIETLIVEGKPYRYITLRFSVGMMALSRHKQNCMKDAVQAAQHEQQVQSGVSATDRLASGERITDAILAVAWSETRKDPDLALRALAELRQQAKLRAEWQRDTAVEQMQERLKVLEQQINDLYRARSA